MYIKGILSDNPSDLLIQEKSPPDTHTNGHKKQQPGLALEEEFSEHN